MFGRCWLRVIAVPALVYATTRFLSCWLGSGLRAGELAALRLDDLDWRAGEIVVRGKGDRWERLPLPVDVGEAIVAYLQHGRPVRVEGRSVFVRVLAPYRGPTSTAVSQIVASAAQRAGLPPVYAHRLRHAAASEMLRAGARAPRDRASVAPPACGHDGDLRQDRP